MKKFFAYSVLFVSIMALYSLFSVSYGEKWEVVAEGLSLRIFDAPLKSSQGDSKITVVKIDPEHYSFKLLSASELGIEPLTAKEWAKQYHLAAAVNAGMYQENGVTNVGYMKNFDHVNNPRLARKYKSVLAFNRTTADVPEIQLIDLDCQGFDRIKGKYNTFIQDIRMISCQGENVWKKQPEAWSMVALGVDRKGKVLLMFTESPYTVHDFIEMLLKLPLALRSAMYLEGGKQASLYLSLNGTEIDKVGAFKSSLYSNYTAWPLPNVIGIVKKQSLRKL